MPGTAQFMGRGGSRLPTPAQTPTTGISGNIVDRGKAWQYQVGASMFGGPTDPGTGSTGYKGDNLHGTHAFAELGMGTLLGNLPYGTELEIAYNGKQVSAKKLDIGLGGGPVGGKVRRIDLWYETAAALGFNGTGVVTIMKPDGGKMNLPGGSQVPVKPGKGSPAALVNNVGDALSSIGHIFAFIFSRQFLYIAAGIPVVFIALAMIYKAQTGSSIVPKHIPVPV